MVYAPDVFTLQARTRSAIKEDGNVSDATVFAAFAAQDHASPSGVVSLSRLIVICSKLDIAWQHRALVTDHSWLVRFTAGARSHRT